MSNCAVCKRDPTRINSGVSECSHVACPTREVAWSSGTKQHRLSKAQVKEGDTTRPIDKIEWDDNPQYLMGGMGVPLSDQDDL